MVHNPRTTANLRQLLFPPSYSKLTCGGIPHAFCSYQEKRDDRSATSPYPKEQSKNWFWVLKKTQSINPGTHNQSRLTIKRDYFSAAGESQ